MLIFTIARVIPGDPARIALGANATQGQVEALRAERHLDAPIIVQYGYFLRDLAHGNLGVSLYTTRPVTADIAQFLPATLELVAAAGLLMMLLGVPLGVASARRRGRLGDHFGRLVSVLCVCTPAFVWGVIFQLVFAYFVPLFPIEGRLSEALPRPRRTPASTPSTRCSPATGAPFSTPRAISRCPRSRSRWRGSGRPAA